MRSRLARWYHEIKLLEDEVQATTLPDLHRRLHWLRELDEIDASVGSISVPEAFIRDTYALKHAIRMVRQRIESRMPLTPAAAGCSRIIQGLIAREKIMEAERLNALSALLADLNTREVELRRYL